MSSRYTVKDAERAVYRLAVAMGVPYGHYTTTDVEPAGVPGHQFEGEVYKAQREDGSWVVTQPDALEVDYNPTYGGCVISQIAPNGRTWVSSPFGYERRSPRQFVSYVNAIIAGIDIGKGS